MQYIAFFRGTNRRYATELERRTVGAEFIDQVRSVFGDVPLSNISCTISARLDENHRVYLSEAQAIQSNVFESHCQIIYEAAAGWLNDCIDIVVGGSATFAYPVYWLNPDKAFEKWMNLGFPVTFFPWMVF